MTVLSHCPITLPLRSCHELSHDPAWQQVRSALIPDDRWSFLVMHSPTRRHA